MTSPSPLRFLPLPEPRDPRPEVAYVVTLARAGRRLLRRRFSCRSAADLYAEKLAQVLLLRSGGPFDASRTFVAVHRHETGPHHGRLEPLALLQ